MEGFVLMDFQEDALRWVQFNNSYSPPIGELLQMGVTLNLETTEFQEERDPLIRKYLAFCLSPIGFGDFDLWLSMVKGKMKDTDIIDLFHYANREDLVNSIANGFFSEDDLTEIAETVLDIWDADTTTKIRSIILPSYEDFEYEFRDLMAVIKDRMQVDEDSLRQAWKEWQGAVPVVPINRFMGAFNELPDMPSSTGLAIGIGSAYRVSNYFTSVSALPMFKTSGETSMKDVLEGWPERGYFLNRYPEQPFWLFHDTYRMIHSTGWRVDYDYDDVDTVHILVEPIKMAAKGEVDSILMPPYVTERTIYMGKTCGFLFSGALSHLGNFEKFLLSEL